MSSERGAYLTVADVAHELGIGRTKAYELVREGALPALRLPGVLRVPRAALAALAATAVPVDYVPGVGDGSTSSHRRR